MVCRPISISSFKSAFRATFGMRFYAIGQFILHLYCEGPKLENYSIKVKFRVYKNKVIILEVEIYFFNRLAHYLVDKGSGSYIFYLQMFPFSRTYA